MKLLGFHFGECWVKLHANAIQDLRILELLNQSIDPIKSKPWCIKSMFMEFSHILSILSKVFWKTSCLTE